MDIVQIDIHRNNIFSLYFGKYEFLIPDLESFDYKYLRSVVQKKDKTIHIKNITFTIYEDVVTATFSGMELKKGLWITGTTQEEHSIKLEDVCTQDLYYMIYLILHMRVKPYSI